MNAQVVPADPLSADPRSPGRQLRSAREARGLDIERTARMLHLTPDTVAAIEKDAFETLPGPVFARGYLRNYARLLNLDEEAVLVTLKAGRPVDPVRPPRVRASARQEIRSSHIVVRFVSWLIALSVAGLLYLWWVNPADLGGVLGVRPGSPFGEPRPGAPSQSTPAKSTSPTTTSTLPAAPRVEPSAAPLSPSAKPDPTPSSVRGSDSIPPLAPPQRVEPSGVPATAPRPTPSQSSERPAVPATAPAEALTPSAGGQGVVLEFNDNAWVDVRDAANSFRIRGEMHKGERRELGGTPPYTLVLGNAGSVRVLVNGEPFDTHARTRGNVARFTLNPKTGE